MPPRTAGPARPAESFPLPSPEAWAQGTLHPAGDLRRRALTRPSLASRATAVLMCGWSLLAAGCTSGARTPEVRVLAASSLVDVLSRCSARAPEVAGARLKITYGASSEATAWLRQGMQADLVILADGRLMEALQAEHLVAPPEPLWSNALVLIGPAFPAMPQRTPIPPLSSASPTAEAGRSPAASTLPTPLGRLDPRLLGVQRLAMGEPGSVPVGRYAQQALRSLDSWDAMRPRAVYARDARLALRWVVDGVADGGLVYRSDALAAREQVRVLATVEPSCHSPIRYLGALASQAAHPHEARRLIEHMRSAEGRALARSLGLGDVAP